MPKLPANWSQNISAEANLKTYNDPTVTYNSTTVTYSSIVVGDQAETDKVPAAWSAA